MLESDLIRLLDNVQTHKCETQTLEIKTAARGCPEYLFDTLSSFSNQIQGGTILFGVSEKDGFKEVGVYDAQDLQKRIVEACRLMSPEVRPLLTVAHRDGKAFVSAEIPGLEAFLRPCFYTGPGRMRGSYVRVRDADKLMSEFEIYNYEVFKQRIQNDTRVIEDAGFEDLDPGLLLVYLGKLVHMRPNIKSMGDEKILNLMKMIKDGHPTLMSLMLFGIFPQAYLPQLSIIATVVKGSSAEEIGKEPQRFADNERLIGTIPEMLDRAIGFIQRNSSTAVFIDPKTGKRTDRSVYPAIAIREAVLNALMHRDYSMNTEKQPIRIVMFNDRIEITNPGGFFGRLTADTLGQVQPDTRNPALVNALELLECAENRYSGIPAIRNVLREAGLPEPVFSDSRDEFKVIIYGSAGAGAERVPAKNRSNRRRAQELWVSPDQNDGTVADSLLSFCSEPRSRQQISDFLGISTTAYVTNKFLRPLIDEGKLEMTIPDSPRSRHQRYKAKGNPEDED